MPCSWAGTLVVRRTILAIHKGVSGMPSQACDPGGAIEPPSRTHWVAPDGSAFSRYPSVRTRKHSLTSHGFLSTHQMEPSPGLGYLGKESPLRPVSSRYPCPAMAPCMRSHEYPHTGSRQNGIESSSKDSSSVALFSGVYSRRDIGTAPPFSCPSGPTASSGRGPTKRIVLALISVL